MSSTKMMSRSSRVLSGTALPVPSVNMTATVQICTTSTNKKSLSLATLNPNIIKLQYAVLGPLFIRAAAIKKELDKGDKKPFTKMILANVEDAQAIGGKPITYIRQVLSCVVNPELLKSGKFPADVKDRAIEILKSCSGGSVGSYTMSNGLEFVRKHVADYIERRDGQKANWNDIALTTGASAAIKNCLQLLRSKIDGKDSGVLIPIPQYPLYSASLAEYGLGQIGYFLDEEKNWAIDVAELERAFADGRKTHAIRAIVVINPGNPTGQVLTRENMEEIVKFAQKHNLMLFADEVYQDNVYASGSKFFSFKKVVTEMSPPYNQIELASFMSISKGYMTECGLRGGWMELVNIDPDVQANLYKAMSVMICPNSVGQCAIDMVAQPPCPEHPSYKQWLAEKTTILDTFKMRAKLVVEAFNKMEGFKCNVVQGTMYAFPRIELPPKAVEAAKAEKKPADTFYAFKLLESTGICIVPGSGFGQRPGTYHFRTTILPQMEMLKEMLEMFKSFHQKFTKEYSDNAAPVKKLNVMNIEKY